MAIYQTVKFIYTYGDHLSPIRGVTHLSGPDHVMLKILVTQSPPYSLFTPDKSELTNERPGLGRSQPIRGRETQLVTDCSCPGPREWEQSGSDCIATHTGDIFQI